MIGERLQGPNEPVAMARQRFDELWRSRRIAERFAHFPDRVVQADLEVDEGLRSPQTLTKFVAGDDLSRPTEQQLEYLKCLVRKPDPQAAPAKLARPWIELEYAEAKYLARLGGWMSSGLLPC